MAKRIAIVEDDPDQRNNYVDAITKKGYDVVAYSSQAEALAGFERELPDLVILDIILGLTLSRFWRGCTIWTAPLTLGTRLCHLDSPPTLLTRLRRSL